MHSFKAFILSLALVFLLIPSAAAFVSGIPESITFREIPKEMSFAVSNSEDVARELKITLFFPLEYQFVEKPGIIEPGKTETVTIKFFPRRDLIGTEFFGTIRIVLGNSVAEKNIKMVFLPQNVCPVSINSSVKTQEGDGQKTFLIVSELENHKQEQASISFEKIEGLPPTWKADVQKLEKIGPFEKIFHEIVLTPVESFDGELQVVYDCEGFIEKRTIRIKHENGAGFLGGLVTFVPFDFGDGFLLNLLLVIIAAVLLVAFISRLVTKLSAEKKMYYQTAPPLEVRPQTGQKDYQYSTTTVSDKRLVELKERIIQK